MIFLISKTRRWAGGGGEGETADINNIELLILITQSQNKREFLRRFILDYPS